MNYIINPMWFYWLQVISVFSVIFVVAAVLTGCLIVGLSIFYFVDGFDDTGKIAKALKKLAIALAILIVACAVVPTKETLIEMMIAKYATVENVGFAIDSVKQATDYVINAIQQAKG